jgi:peptidoglycan/LPS O-acetylase OafA/YrhL
MSRVNMLVAAQPTTTSSTATATSQSRVRSFRPDVEGLRAIAVVLVLLEHAGLSLVSGGFIGVDVFFVLSGFLITGLMLKEIESTGRISIVQFYARRARRLLPAGTLVLSLTVIASYLWLGGARADRVAEDARWSALFASNFRFIQQGTDYLDAQLPPSPLQHFWSLAVEEQFYAVWPLVMMLVAFTFKRIALRLRLAIALTAIIAASLVWSIHQTSVDGTAAYFSPFPRASELAAGALLAVSAPWLVRLPRRIGPVISWGGVAAIFLISLTFSSSTIFPGYAVMAPVFAAVLVVAGGSIAPGEGAEKLLRLKPFQLIGKVSYSLYLWHWPILVIAAGKAGHDLSVEENLLLCLVALGLSAITYVLIENPVRNATSLKQHTPLASIGLGVALVALAFGLSTWYIQTQSTPGEAIVADAEVQQFPLEEDIISAVAAGVDVTSWPDQPPRIANLAYSKDCNVTRADTNSSACEFGDLNGSTTAVIYGDSHAAMWVPALDAIGKQAGIKFVQLTKPGCPSIDFTIYSQTLKREYTECDEYRAFALSKIAELQPDVVLLSNAYRDVKYSDDGKASSDGVSDVWMKGLTSIIEQIQPNAGRIVVIGDMAYPNFSGIDCLTANPGNVGACNTPRSDAVDEDHNTLEGETAIAAGATYVDTIPWFCTDTVCPAVIGGLTVHRDSYHTGENYVVFLAQALAEKTGLIPEGTRLKPSGT